MEKLIKGIHHFTNEIFATKRELFENLARGQNPDVLFITCSDSRVDPQLITQTDPGDLFMVRNIGNLVPVCSAGENGTGAAIEYALAVLKVKHIVICGHSHCGAMRALLDPEGLSELPSVCDWLGYAHETRRIINENYSHLDYEQQLNIAVQENVLVQLENLRTHKHVAAALDSGKLDVQGWVYKIQTGDVFIYNPDKSQFLAHSQFGQLMLSGSCNSAA